MTDTTVEIDKSNLASALLVDLIKATPRGETSPDDELATYLFNLICSAEVLDINTNALNFRHIMVAGQFSIGLSLFETFSRNVRKLVNDGTRIGLPLDLRYCSSWKKLNVELQDLLLYIKYFRFNLHNEDTDLDIALQQLGDQLDFSGSIYKFVYSHDKSNSISYDEWAKSVRYGYALDIVSNDRFPADLARFKDALLRRIEPSIQDMRLNLDPNVGCVVLISHNGYVQLRKDCFDKLWPSGLHLSVADSPPKNPLTSQSDIFINGKFICVYRNGVGFEGSLLSAVRALGSGKSVLMAPDGNHRKSAMNITVLGKNFPIATGGAFMSYESGAPVYWLRVDAIGQNLKLVLEEGPKKNSGEKYKDFLSRYLQFCESAINEEMTRRPNSMVPYGGTLKKLV